MGWKSAVVGFAIGACVVAMGWSSTSHRHHVAGSVFNSDPTRARVVSYGADGTVVYWADVPPGTAEVEITIKGADSIGSVHVVQAMTMGGLFCASQSDGTCK